MMVDMDPGTEKQFEYLDDKLIAAGVPLRYRPLDCFKKLYGSVPDGRRRIELFDPLIDWYLKGYGDAVRWNGIVARFPIRQFGRGFGKANLWQMRDLPCLAERDILQTPSGEFAVPAPSTSCFT